MAQRRFGRGFNGSNVVDVAAVTDVAAVEQSPRGSVVVTAETATGTFQHTYASFGALMADIADVESGRPDAPFHISGRE